MNRNYSKTTAWVFTKLGFQNLLFQKTMIPLSQRYNIVTAFQDIEKKDETKLIGVVDRKFDSLTFCHKHLSTLSRTKITGLFSWGPNVIWFTFNGVFRNGWMLFLLSELMYDLFLREHSGLFQYSILLLHSRYSSPLEYWPVSKCEKVGGGDKYLKKCFKRIYYLLTWGAKVYLS